jgi:hypothetical protein
MWTLGIVFFSRKSPETAAEPEVIDKDKEQQKLESEMQKRRERIEKVGLKIS